MQKKGRDTLIPALAELFRERGFEGASLADITDRTGLGKGSLYHLFPNGKEEMAKAVLDDVAGWFEAHVFEPLRDSDDPATSIRAMFDAVDRFFHGGGRVCLVGTFALDETRDRFASEIQSYFAVWVAALAEALTRCGIRKTAAREAAEETVAGIQGALVLARSLQDPAVFTRATRRLRRRLVASIKDSALDQNER